MLATHSTRGPFSNGYSADYASCALPPMWAHCLKESLPRLARGNVATCIHYIHTHTVHLRCKHNVDTRARHCTTNFGATMKRAEGRGVICALNAMAFDAVVPRRRASAPPLQPQHHVCACVRERERIRERASERERARERDRERERERERECVCVCVRAHWGCMHALIPSRARSRLPRTHLSKDAVARDNIPLDPDARPRFCDKL